MRLAKDISERIDALRFPLIVGVVWIHAYPTTGTVGSVVYGNPNPGYWATLIRNMFSEVTCRIPVPMLFLLSGYLFFLGMESHTPWKEAWLRFLGKWKNRLRTLLVPYLIWNLLVMGLILAIQESPIRGYFSETARVSQFNLLGFFNAWLGWTHPPIAYQLWFVRNLMILALLAPLIYLLLRRLPVAYLVGMGLVWVLTLWPIKIPDSPGVFFFSLGGGLAIYGADLRRLDRWWPWLLALYMLIAGTDLLHKNHWYSENLHRLGLFCGLPLVFSLTARISERWRQRLILLAPISFFLYALHEPLLSLVRRFDFSRLHPQSDVQILIFYVINPLLVIILCVGIFKMMERYVPSVLSILTGDRRK